MQRKNKVFLGVSRFATVPWAVSQIGRVHSQTSALIWCGGIRKRLLKLRMQKMLTKSTKSTKSTMIFFWKG